MDKQTQTIVIIVGGAVVVWAIWYMMKPKYEHHRKAEQFMTANDISHLDSIDPNGPMGTAQPPDVPFMGQPVESSLDQAYGIPSAGDRYDALLASNISPMEAAALPQFNVDVTNPANWTAQVQLRLPMKNPQWLQSDKLRGDIPIQRPGDGNSCLISTSRYSNRDSLNYQGFFSPYSNLARFQSAYMKNTPCGVSNQGTDCDL